MADPDFDSKPLTRELLKNHFGSTIYHRGLNYFREGRVYECKTDEDGTVRAKVRGSDFALYKVVLRPTHGLGLPYKGSCSCPYEASCKHMVAVLLEVLETRGPDVAVDVPSEPQAMPEKYREWLSRLAGPDAQPEAPPESKDSVLYILKPTNERHWKLELEVARRLQDGSWGVSRSCSTYNTSRGAPPKYVSRADVPIFKDIERLRDYPYRLKGFDGRRILEAAIGTGRCFIGSKSGKRAFLGAERACKGAWEVLNDGSQRFAFVLEGTGKVMPLDGLWYVDETTGQVGSANSGLSSGMTNTFLDCPRLEPEHSSAVRDDLTTKFPDREDLWPQPASAMVFKTIPPTPRLKLTRVKLEKSYSFGRGDRTVQDAYALFADLTFRYGDLVVKPGDRIRTLVQVEAGQTIRMPRQADDEGQAFTRLVDLGFTNPGYSFGGNHYVPGNWSGFPVLKDHDKLPTYDELVESVSDFVPRLRAAGWEVEVDDDLIPIDFGGGTWEAEVEESTGMDWFSVNLGVIVDGEKFDLKPILLRFLTWSSAADRKWLAEADDEDRRVIHLPDGRYARITAGRARVVLKTLRDLFALDDSAEIPATAAPFVSELSENDWLTWRGGDAVKDLGSRLTNFQGLQPAQVPTGLKATLRQYQLEGLSWLGFLAEFGFGGILADDMGLGKTVQTLAHILAEKEAGRLGGPCLVVAPTSLLGNWNAEAAKWAPELSVLTLHGPSRSEVMSEIPNHDIVLTTYPLLARDEEALLAHEFGLTILDEAQNVKNPKAAVSQVACRLHTKRRLCLTGTPMENHLGELWSLFRFLMPGFLGSEAKFRSVFRVPIESRGDAEARDSLRRRIRPFILRRNKDEVAKELPAKSEVVETIELEGPQRDLYETVRLAMHQKVREAIQAKGVAKSHILVLDALLKLRQICCDPRLMKADSAKKPPGSAKLARLLDIIPELIDEGSRILLFSQFTSMLELIEPELDKRAIAFVKLTGQTKDRVTPVRKFQEGEVPLFLISLKAGGTGLNLTAADTVIHFDPWWNPAVETQATDRAHRIGQDKPVFVYKLITAGTVEEKICDLQNRKRELVGSLLDGGEKQGVQLTAEDLDMLFQPL